MQAVFGAVYALPAAVAMLSDPPTGLALSMGVLPAAIVGLAPTRRGRRIVVMLGTLIGVPIFLGSLLAGVPWLAVATIGGLGVAAALLAARSRFGFIAMNLSLPMIGVGLSYTDIGQSAGLAVLMIAGSVYAPPSRSARSPRSRSCGPTRRPPSTAPPRSSRSAARRRRTAAAGT